MSLIFWNDQTLEDRSGGCYDGAIIEVSTNGGTSYTPIGGASMLTDPYEGPINGASNALNGINGWCGDPQPYLRSVVDVTALAGETVRFRFRVGTDTSVGRVPHGWYIDDVTVQSCNPAPLSDVIFANGFDPVMQ